MFSSVILVSFFAVGQAGYCSGSIHTGFRYITEATCHASGKCSDTTHNDKQEDCLAAGTCDDRKLDKTRCEEADKTWTPKHTWTRNDYIWKVLPEYEGDLPSCIEDKQDQMCRDGNRNICAFEDSNNGFCPECEEAGMVESGLHVTDNYRIGKANNMLECYKECKDDGTCVSVEWNPFNKICQLNEKNEPLEPFPSWLGAAENVEEWNRFAINAEINAEVVRWNKRNRKGARCVKAATCKKNQHVKYHDCVNCPDGLKRHKEDDSEFGDTSCSATCEGAAAPSTAVITDACYCGKAGLCKSGGVCSNGECTPAKPCDDAFCTSITNGTCSGTGSSRSCTCEDGFTGTNCEKVAKNGMSRFIPGGFKSLKQQQSFLAPYQE